MSKGSLIKGLLQYAQYSVIGISCGVIDLVSLNLLLFLWPTENDLLITLFNTIAYSLAVLNSYIWNSRLTFSGHNRKNFRQKSFFILQALVSLLVSNGVLLLALWLFGLTDLPKWFIHNVSKLLSMLLSSTTSFFLMKFFVFGKARKNER